MMKRLLLAGVTSLAIAVAVTARAQDPETATPPQADAEGRVESPSDLPPAMHPDTWAQLQRMRRYDSPRQMARMKAAEEAQQRRARLSAQRWYGYYPSRPVVGATPSMGNYYPIWNTDVPRPFRWYGINTYPIETDLFDPNLD